MNLRIYSIAILSALLLAGCVTPKHLALPHTSINSNQVNPNIVIRNLEIPLTDRDNKSEIAQFQAEFEKSIQSNLSLSQLYNRYPNLIIDVIITPEKKTHKTWILDIPFFYPTLGLWPFSPWWGYTSVNIDIHVNLPASDNARFNFESTEDFNILFYPYYLAGFTYTNAYQTHYSKLLRQISQYNFVINWNGYLGGKVLEHDGTIPPPPQIATRSVTPGHINTHTSELLLNVPITNTTQEHTYALIIGNEDYQSRQRGLTTEQNVDFAENDALVFAQYCERTLGIPQRHIRLLTNATAAEIYQGVAWLRNLADIEEGKAKLIFYFSGHGLPHEETREPYLIPVDVSGSNLEFAVKLDHVYRELTKHPSEQVVAIIDACFSGGARNKELLAMKAVRVRPRQSELNSNIVVLSSSSGDEASGVFRLKKHGYFTYFLLRKLQETEGDVTLSELSSYVRVNVRRETGLDGVIQTPQVLVSPEIETKWGGWTLK